MYVVGVGLVKVHKALVTGGTVHPPSDIYVRRFLYPFLYFNKTLLHKSSWVIKPGPWFQSEIFFGDHKSNVIHCKLSLGIRIFYILSCATLKMNSSVKSNMIDLYGIISPIVLICFLKLFFFSFLSRFKLQFLTLWCIS